MASSASLEAATRARSGAGTARRARPGALLRSRTWLRRGWLDGAISRGVDADGDAALALRHAQLVRRRERDRLARRFEEVLAARPRPAAPSSAVPIDHKAVAVARPVLTEIVLSLRSSDAVEARGVVLGWRLLTDAGSPIYAPPGGRPANTDGLWYESLALLFALRPLPAAPARTPEGRPRQG